MLLAWIAPLLALANPTPGWVPTPLGEVTVHMPGPVQRRTTTTTWFVGQVVTETAVGEMPGAWFAATVVTLPGTLASITPSRVLYRYARQELLRETKGTMITEEDLKSTDRSCRRMTFTTLKDSGTEQHGVSDVYLTGRHVVTLTVVRHGPVSAEVERQFLASAQWGGEP